MTRKILFKAKRKDNNEWVQGNLIYDNVSDKYWIDLCIEESEVTDGGLFIVAIEVIPETICEYTGKNDKNGKMIFENDYLKPPLFLDSEQRTCLCIYNQENNVNEIIGFGLYWNNSYFSKYQDLICSDEWEEFEVIGNKFDEGDNDE